MLWNNHCSNDLEILLNSLNSTTKRYFYSLDSLVLLWLDPFPLPVYVTGSDEPEVRPRTVLRGETGNYELRRFRFNGCFSNVAECKEVGTGDAVVIKIFKKRAPGSLEPNKEVHIVPEWQV